MLGLGWIATLPATLSAQDPVDVQGSYIFRVLSTDREEVVAEGQFVLGVAEFDLREIDDEVLSFATERSFWLLRPGDAPARVCFGFERSQDYVEGREFYEGVIPVGLSNWTVERGELRIHVYQSPYASQHLAGRAQKWGWRSVCFSRIGMQAEQVRLWSGFRSRRSGSERHPSVGARRFSAS